MKKIVMIISMAIATIGFSYAQQDQNMQQQEQQMSQIDKEELPENIQTSFESGEFRGWEIEQAYEVKEGESDYAVKVKRGEETKLLHFDNEGNLVKQEELEGTKGQPGQF